MNFVSLNNNTTDVSSGAETDNPSKAPALIPVISGIRVFQFLDFCVVFCRSLFVLFVWPLYFLPFFDLRFLIIPLSDLQTLLNDHDIHKQRSTKHYKEI